MSYNRIEGKLSCFVAELHSVSNSKHTIILRVHYCTLQYIIMISYHNNIKMTSYHNIMISSWYHFDIRYHNDIKMIS